MKNKEPKRDDQAFWDKDAQLGRKLDAIEKKLGRPPKDRESATGQIQLRVTMSRKNAYVKAAKPLKLTEWIFRELDKEAGYEPTDHDR